MNRPLRFPHRRLLALTLLASVPVLANAAGHSDYQPGNQYTARLEQARQHWQLLPAEGTDLRVSAAGECAGSAPVPTGLWLLARDADGRPQLRAPSTTALPPGHPGAVALVPCGTAIAGEESLAAPALLIELLAAHSGAVWIDD